MDVLFIILFLLFLAIPCLVIYLIYRLVKKLRKAGHRKLALVIPAVIVSFVAYNVYTAIYPTEDFYRTDFERETGFTLPPSAEFVEKTCSYPDFHGHYYEAALIRLSTADYKQLQSRLGLNPSFILKKDNDAFFGNSIQWLKENNIKERDSFSSAYQIEKHKRFNIGFGLNNLVLIDKSP